MVLNILSISFNLLVKTAEIFFRESIKPGVKPIEQKQKYQDKKQNDNSPLFTFVQGEKITNPVFKSATHGYGEGKGLFSNNKGNYFLLPGYSSLSFFDLGGVRITRIKK